MKKKLGKKQQEIVDWLNKLKPHYMYPLTALIDESYTPFAGYRHREAIPILNRMIEAGIITVDKKNFYTLTEDYRI